MFDESRLDKFEPYSNNYRCGYPLAVITFTEFDVGTFYQGDSVRVELVNQRTRN